MTKSPGSPTACRLPPTGRRPPATGHRPPTFGPAIAALLLLASGCAYYNTFYNARSAYADGVKLVATSGVASAKPKFESAIKKSAAVIKNYSTSRWVDDALYLVGMSYYQMGDYPRAIAKFENLEAVFPDSPFLDDAQFYRALALIGDRQYARGVGQLKVLRDSSRRFRQDAAFELAATNYRQGDYAAAITALKAFDAEYPRSRHTRDLRLMLADSYFHQGRYQEAAATFNLHRRLATHSREKLPDDLSIADCYLLGNCPDSALALMQKQPIDRFPEHADRVNLITGKALLALGRKTDGRAALSKVKTGAFSAEANFLIGRSFEQDTGFDQAYAYYDTARMREPTSAYAILANSRHLLIDRLLKGLKGEGDTAQAKFLLAEVYHLNLNQDSTAVIQYQKVADSFPGSDYAPKALYAVAWIRGNRLKADDSSAAYQAVIDRYPRTVFAQEARRVLGKPLLPQSQIEVPPEVKAESLRLRALRDSAVVQKARNDSLARLAQVSQLDTLKHEAAEPAEPPTSARGERGRDRRSGREHAPTPPMPEPLPPGQVSPASPDSVRKPMVGPAIGESLPPKPAPQPESLTKPPPLPPKPDTGKVAVVPQAKPPMPPEPVKPETAQKPAPVAPKPETAAKPPPTIPAPAKPEPVGGERSVSVGASFFPDTGMGAVFFGHDSTRIRDEDTAMLRANVEYLKKHPELELTLVGWCDSAGEPPYNLALGMRRAQAVRRWLVKNGIDAARVSLQSYGSEWSEETEPDAMWRDRRCEFWTRKK